MSFYDALLDDSPEPLKRDWENHGAFLVMTVEHAWAVIFLSPSPHGMVRFGPQHALSLGMGSVNELQARAEAAFEQGPTAYDRLLDDLPDQQEPTRPDPIPEELRVERELPRATGRSLRVVPVGGRS